MRIALAVIVLGSVTQASAEQADKKTGKLTPYTWTKDAGAQAESGADQPAKPAPARKRLIVPKKAEPGEDELVCEKDKVYPVEDADPSKPPMLGQAAGVRHCWKKSDPHTIIKKPYTFADGLGEAVGGAMESAASGKGGFSRPLGAPKVPRKIKRKTN